MIRVETAPQDVAKMSGLSVHQVEQQPQIHIVATAGGR
jgi:hypothetical protein